MLQESSLLAPVNPDKIEGGNVDARLPRGPETFNNLNVEYEHAYEDNKFKKACITTAISMLPLGSTVLDVGYGTGVPVSDMLAKAGLSVIGFDISPKMIALAQARVKGDFSVSDMLNYQPEDKVKFAGVFMIFAHLQLSYAASQSAVCKFASALHPGGILALGQMPSDSYVKDESEYDETKSYVEDYDAPFMGEMLPTFMMSAEGQRKFFTSMGLEMFGNRLIRFSLGIKSACRKCNSISLRGDQMRSH